VTGLNDTTRDSLRGTIEDAISEGWDLPELATEIDNNFAFGEYRSQLIAKNEIALVYSRGRQTAAAAAGATKKVSLLSSDHDDEENCSCTEAADAGEVDFDESFVEGDDDYMFAPYHVNCQCDWAGVYGEAEEDDEEADDGDEGEDEEHGKFAKGGPGSGPHPGLGPKPTGTKETSVKGKIHELFSSGHSFTMSELEQATGLPKSKLIGPMHTLTSDKGLNDKFGIVITKTGAYYQAVLGAKPSGTGAFGTGKQAVGDSKATASVVSTLEETGSKSDAENEYMSAPPKMSVADADTQYKMALNKAMMNLGNSAGQKTDLAEFKMAKAQAMADWKANTTGTKVEPVGTVSVFGADANLYANIKGGMMLDTAYAQWKKDTDKEKAGKAVESGTAKEMTAAPVVQPVGKPETPYEIVPKGYEQISKSDFIPTGESGYCKFGIQMDRLRNQLKDESSAVNENKANVQALLSKELQNSPNFQALKTAAGDYPGKSQQGTLESRLVAQWAADSGDSNNTSVALQLAARDAFEMDSKHLVTSSLHSLSAGEEQVYKYAAGSLTGKQENGPLVRAGMQEFLHGMYRVTQNHLASLGVKDVYVARGMKTGGSAHELEIGKLKLQPISSFSTNWGTANSSVFKGDGNVYLVKVPASQVLSTYLTGFGCTSEHEVTLLSNTKLKALRGKFSGSTHGTSASSATVNIHNLVTMAGEKG
jgi:hypothetical protein